MVTMGYVEMWSTAFSVGVALASPECSVRLTLMTVWEWTVLEMVGAQCVCVCVFRGLNLKVFVLL